MKILKLRGSTSNILRVFLQDSRVTDGSGLTGLSSASSGLKIVTIADVEASVTSYTVAGSTIESITTLGTFATPTATKCRFKEIDSTNLPGWYEIQLDDARFAVSNSKALQIMIFGASNLVPCNVEVQLAAGLNVDDAVRAGLTALPNAAAEASGGLFTRGTGAGQINQDANGRIDANVKTWIGGAIPAVNVTGVPIVDAKYLLGTVIATPATAGIMDINVINWKGSTAPAMTGDAYARLGAPAGASVSADIATVAGYVDTEVAAVLAAVDTEVAAIKAKTDNLPATPAATGDAMTLADGAITAAKIAADAITAAKIADGAIDAATFAAGAINNAALAAETGLKSVRSNTAQAGGALSITLDASASAVNDFYARQVIAIVGGTGAGQTNVIASYVGATKAATVEHAWATNPDNTSVFAILPTHVQVAADFDDAILDGVVEGTTTLRQSARLWNAAAGGKASGLATTSAAFRDLADSKDRIAATVDADGNRSAVTLDLT